MSFAKVYRVFRGYLRRFWLRQSDDGKGWTLYQRENCR